MISTWSIFPVIVTGILLVLTQGVHLVRSFKGPLHYGSATDRMVAEPEGRFVEGHAYFGKLSDGYYYGDYRKMRHEYGSLKLSAECPRIGAIPAPLIHCACLRGASQADDDLVISSLRFDRAEKTGSNAAISPESRCSGLRASNPLRGTLELIRETRREYETRDAGRGRLGIVLRIDFRCHGSGAAYTAKTWRLGDVVRSASRFGFSSHRRKLLHRFAGNHSDWRAHDIGRTRQDAFMKDQNRGAHALLHYVAI
jgi:hypothetical protein